MVLWRPVIGRWAGTLRRHWQAPRDGPALDQPTEPKRRGGTDEVGRGGGLHPHPRLGAWTTKYTALRCFHFCSQACWFHVAGQYYTSGIIARTISDTLCMHGRVGAK